MKRSFRRKPETEWSGFRPDERPKHYDGEIPTVCKPEAQRIGPDRGKEFAMLTVHLKNGEYLTIGEDIVVQVFTKSTVRVAVQAPRELTVLRGEVLERNGEDRPSCLRDSRPQKQKTEDRNEVSPG